MPVTEIATITNPVPACPCVCCGTTEGDRQKRRGKVDRKPSRYNAERFGIPGMICKRCCRRFTYREAVALGKMGIKREPRRDENRITYVPTPEQIAENARIERESWGMTGTYRRNDGAELRKAERAEKLKAKHARRAEIERADARMSRARRMRGHGVLQRVSQP